MYELLDAFRCLAPRPVHCLIECGWVEAEGLHQLTDSIPRLTRQVTVGAIGGVLHLSPESPTLVGNSGMLDDDSSAAAAAATTAAGGGEKKGVSSSKKGIFFLSEGSASDRAATLHQAGLRVIEDRTASASSTVWGHKVMDVLGQEALAVLVLLLGGGVVLLLMRWRRRGPWSPRIPR